MTRVHSARREEECQNTLREVEQLEDNTEVEVVPEVDLHPPARRAWFNDANNSFQELSDHADDSDLGDDDWEENEMEEEDEFSNNQEDSNKEATAEGREELLNKM